jgi:hypothetical protein
MNAHVTCTHADTGETREAAVLEGTPARPRVIRWPTGGVYTVDKDGWLRAGMRVLRWRVVTNG